MGSLNGKNVWKEGDPVHKCKECHDPKKKKGKAYKLDEVTFHIDTTDYMKPWKFSSNDERFEMDFEPILDRQGKTNFLIIKSIQHQVFGYYTGYLVLDDGTKLKVDRFLGFAEDVLNWW